VGKLKVHELAGFQDSHLQPLTLQEIVYKLLIPIAISALG
jgi:hypothetical protein